MERPILFNTEMVRAILDGRKTQTRRIVKIDPCRVYEYACVSGNWYETYDPENPPSHLIEWYLRTGTIAPYIVGDVLWVRETWCKGRVEYGEEPDGRNVPYIEQCTGDDDIIPKEWAIRHGVGTEDVVWRPSIHMPREAARIFLRVTYVRAERLQDMDEISAMLEGFPDSPAGTDSPLERFSVLWDKTIKRDNLREYGWHANPWVWVIEFERVERPASWEV